ncbi:hypothetical protein [Synechococcus sp. CC9616]|uniref:hypothetical protein n=1 Tax=Synechococcus sp. CC9616 TaxID=110663 RepID=UPI0012EBC4EE|nr:hypothetical protein [Synechococcus sp. CC9616]
MSNPFFSELCRDFYRLLLKSDLTLEERYRIGNLVSQISAKNQLDRWKTITKARVEFSSQLNSLVYNGFLRLNIPFSSLIIDEISSLPCQGHGKYSDGNRVETEYLHNVSSLSSVRRLCSDSQLNTLVSLYLGAPAYLYECEAWWQYPQGNSHRPSNAQLWHRDRDDFHELKLFFYVTDVDQECGPHAFIPHSHNPSTISIAFDDVDYPLVSGRSSSFIDDDHLQHLGLLVSPKVWLGKAGTCFLEDPRGYHRAYLPTLKPRLMFSLVWTVGPGFNH